jgi:hypothetical protein
MITSTVLGRVLPINGETTGRICLGVDCPKMSLTLAQKRRVIDTWITAEDRIVAIGYAFSEKARRKSGLFVSHKG